MLTYHLDMFGIYFWASVSCFGDANNFLRQFDWQVNKESLLDDYLCCCVVAPF